MQLIESNRHLKFHTWEYQKHSGVYNDIQQDILFLYGHKPNLTAKLASGRHALGVPSSWRVMQGTAHLKERVALTLF